MMRKALTRLHNASNRPNPHGPHSHVPEASVLARPHVHHPAPVVGLLVHEPVALHHIAGLAVRHAETLLDGVTVVHELMHLPTEVLLLENPHAEGSSVLL